jgi:hypothetical protein
MSAASDYLENKVLDHVLRYGTDAYTAPTTLYLALFTGTAADVKGRLEAGTLSDEISTSGTAYGRKTIAFNTASAGTSSSNATVTFDTATGNWGSVTCVAVMDAATAGNVLFYGEVTTAKTIETGDTFQVSSGNLTISLA